MMRFKLNLIIDIILTYLIFFVLFYSWINFYKRNITFSFISSLIISFFVVFFIFFLKNKWSKKKTLSITQKENIEKCITNLKFLPKQKVINYFYQNIRAKEKVNKHKNFLETEQYVIYPFFDKQILDEDQLISIYKEVLPSGKETLILCNQPSKESQVLASKIANLKITILNAEQTYQRFLNNFSSLPEDVTFSKNKKLAFKELMSYVSSKERTKNYLLMGLILIISSFFVMFKIYYLVFGSLLLFMALLTRLLPYFPKTKK